MRTKAWTILAALALKEVRIVASGVELKK